MKIKDIEKALNDALQAPDNADLRNAYCDTLTEYLNVNEATDEIISIVVKGIELDRAANFFDFLEGVSASILRRVMKLIRKNQEIKENADNCGVKFLSGMLAMALMKVGKLESQCGDIMTFLVSEVTNGKKPVSTEEYGPILLDYILDDLNPKTILPKWETIKAPLAVQQQFAEMLMTAAEGENTENYKAARQWAAMGIRHAEVQLKKQKIEEKIPQSHIAELLSIADHYRTIEEQLRNSVYREVKLEDDISLLNKQIEVFKGEKRELELRIHNLSAEVEEKQKLLYRAEKEVGERAAINEAFGALKKNDESALLKDIANELKAEYQDFIESEADEMDVQLGEIYREKLKNIFKLLNKKGIAME